MIGGRISIDEWRARFGVPALDAAPPFRDDPPSGHARMPLWQVFSDPDAPAFCLMTATPAEAERAGMSWGSCFTCCRISRLWSRGAGGRRNIASLFMAVDVGSIEEFNTATDKGLAWLWRQGLSLGQEPEIEPLACCIGPPMTDQPKGE